MQSPTFCLITPVKLRLGLKLNSYHLKVCGQLLYIYLQNYKDWIGAPLTWNIYDPWFQADLGDGVIIGMSSTEHLLQNLDAAEEGPLDEGVVAAFDEAWNLVAQQCPKYFRWRPSTTTEPKSPNLTHLQKIDLLETRWA